MSIERDLLKEVLEYFDPLGLNTEHCGDLPERIKELLAQPEQTEQEPVAWMWTRNYEGGGYTNKVFEFLNDAEEYAKDSKTLKSPDIIRPLYTAPPKREPLSDEKLEIMYSKHAFAMDKQESMWGFRDAERAHGIGVDDEN